MRKRIGNDIQFTWRIMRHEDGTLVPESFIGKDVTVELIAPSRRVAGISDVRIGDGIVTFTFPGMNQTEYGAYTAVLYENRGSDGMVAIDTVEAVTLVRHSFQESNEGNDVIESASVEMESELAARAGGSMEPVQADWEQTDDMALDYIRNKPDMSDYVKKQSETKQAIQSDIEVDGVIESHDQYYLEDNNGWKSLIETIRSQGHIDVVQTDYRDGIPQTRRVASIYGYKSGLYPGSGMSVASYYVLPSSLLLYAEVEIKEDVVLLKRNNDGTRTYHYLSHKQDKIEDLTSIRSGAASGTTAVQPAALATLVNTGTYNPTSKKIELKHDDTVLAEIDATPFIKDGIVDNVTVDSGYLVVTFNTDAGKEPVRLALTDIFNPDNYYTKSQVNGLLNGMEVKVVIEAVASGTTAITATEHKYYVVQGTVGSLTITLPTPEDTAKVQSIAFYFATGASPSVTFSHTSTVYYYDGYSIEANKIYEINALWNGQNWVIAYAVID